MTVTPDEAMDSLHSGLSLADINHLAKSRERILKALELDPTVLERAGTPDECWLLFAKAFAESDPECALTLIGERPPSTQEWPSESTRPGV